VSMSAVTAGDLHVLMARWHTSMLQPWQRLSWVVQQHGAVTCDSMYDSIALSVNAIDSDLYLVLPQTYHHISGASDIVTVHAPPYFLQCPSPCCSCTGQYTMFDPATCMRRSGMLIDMLACTHPPT
jgi:hypothetical protein